jgi:hypothetical protein
MEAQQIGVATSSGKTNSAKHADDIDASRTTEAGQRRYCFFLWKKEVLFNARHFQKTTDLNASDDFEGVVMKISTSNVDVSEPFYINYKYST